MLPRVVILSLVAATFLSTAPPPATAGEPIIAEGQVYAGLYSDKYFSADDLNAFGDWATKKATFAGSFHTPFENATFSNTQFILDQAWTAGSTPVMNLSISDSAANIASGKYDLDITNWALEVKAWLDKGAARGVIIAPFQEMNGNWTPYGMDPANYKNAYTKVRNIFRQLGMLETQVRWAYAPNGWSTPPYGLDDYYPGPDVVDIIGISAYNFGTDISGGSWEAPAQVLDPGLNELRTFAPEKPYFVLQTGSSPAGGNRDQWLRDFFPHVTADPNVVAFVYFNIDATSKGETDWRIWYGSNAGLFGFREGMQAASTKYQWPLTDWFQPGALPFAGYTPPPVVPVCPDGLVCDSVAFVTGGAEYRVYDDIASTSAINSFFYGNPGDVPLMGDWDCDGVTTPAMYRPTNGFMYLRNSNTQGIGEIEYFYGDPSDVPLAGDFDGDGCDTLAIYRPNEGQIYVKNSLGTGNADFSFFFGNIGDKPFVGDFDGDGTDTIGLHRESTGFVYYRNVNSTGVAHESFFFGDPGDKILAGDWDGDGLDTVAVYRPSSNTLYVKNKNVQGNADASLYAGDFDTVLLFGKD